MVADGKYVLHLRHLMNFNNTISVCDLNNNLPNS